MRKKIRLSVAAAMAAGCVGGAAAKATIMDVPNYSFESPAGPFPLQVSLTITGWTTTGPADEVVDVGNGPQNSGVGVFQNAHPGLPGYATNADGSQMAYMFSGSTHALSQVLSTPFAANTRYTLTVGVSDASSPPSPGDQLGIQLFYTTAANPGTPIVLATSSVVQGVDALSSTALTDYSATAATGPNDPAVGNDIGVLFTTTGLGGGEFNLDNVRLDASPVPEPASVIVIGLAAGVVLVRQRRRSPCAE